MAVLRHIHITVGVFTACLCFTCWREATFFLEQWTQTNVSAHNQWACTECVYGYSHSVGIKWMPVEREIIRARENERKGKKTRRSKQTKQKRQTKRKLRQRVSDPVNHFSSDKFHIQTERRKTQKQNSYNIIIRLHFTTERRGGKKTIIRKK